MKKILFFLLIIFMACKKEVQVETLKNTSLEEAWCVDLPKDVLENQQYHFVYEDDIYFFVKNDLYRINKTAKTVSKIKIDWESIGGIILKRINPKYHDGYLFLEIDNDLYRYDLKTGSLKKIFDDVGSFSFSDNENIIYIIHRTQNDDEAAFATLNIETLEYNAKQKISMDYFSYNIYSYEKEIGNEFAFIYSEKKFLLLDITNKRIIKERELDYNLEGNVKNIIFQPLFAYYSAGKIAKIDLKTGQNVWAYSHKRPELYYNKIIFDQKKNFLYCQRQFDEVICLDASSGKEIWSTNIYNNHSIYVSYIYNMFLLDDFIYITNGNDLIVFQTEDGKEIQRQTENFMLGTPSIVDEKNNLIYTFKDGQLCALRGLK